MADQYRFVPTATGDIDPATGQQRGSYFRAFESGTQTPINYFDQEGAGYNNAVDRGNQGMTREQVIAAGGSPEDPWTVKANNSSFSDLAEVTKGFFTDTGGAGALVAAPFIAAGAGELLGAAGVSSPAATGALTGATTSALRGGNPLIGAATGGAGGEFLPGANSDWAQSAINDGWLPATGAAGSADQSVPWMSNADPGGFINPATGQIGPGLPGGADYPAIDPATGLPTQQQNSAPESPASVGGLTGIEGLQAPADATGAFDIGGASGFGGTTPLPTSADASVTGAESFPAGGGGGGGQGTYNDYGSGEADDSGVNDADREANRAAQQAADPQGGAPKPALTNNKSSMQNALDAAMKYGPLALGALGAKSGNQAGQKAADQIRQIPAAQAAIGNQLIQQYQSGTLNANDAASIKQFTQDAIAKSRAYFAKAGLSDSTAANDAEKAIAERAAAMQSQMLQGYLTQGMSALNITDQYQLAAVQAELQGSKDATKATTDFLNAYGSWLRGSGTMTGQTTTPATGATGGGMLVASNPSP